MLRQIKIGENMDLNEAIKDPNRPLNIKPTDWILQTERNLQALEKNKIIVASVEKDIKDGNSIAVIDNGVDMIVQGIHVVLDGLNMSKRVDLNIKDRAVIEKIKDLIETAIVPYTSDIIKELDYFDKE